MDVKGSLRPCRVTSWLTHSLPSSHNLPASLQCTMHISKHIVHTAYCTLLIVHGERKQTPSILDLRQSSYCKLEALILLHLFLQVRSPMRPYQALANTFQSTLVHAVYIKQFISQHCVDGLKYSDILFWMVDIYWLKCLLLLNTIATGTTYHLP